MRIPAVALIIACCAAQAVVSAAPGDNMLDNGGFEKGPWAQSEAWHGEISVVDEPVLEGTKAGKLVAGPEGDAMIYTGYVPVAVGLDYRFTIMARGSGTLSLRSTQVRSVPDDPYLIERPEARWQLTDEWQEASIEVSPRDPLVTRLGIMVQLEGEGAEAILDDALLTPNGLPGGMLTIEPSYVMLAPGETTELRVCASSEAGPVTEGTLVVSVNMGDVVSREELTIAGETTTWTFTAPEDIEPVEATVSIVNAQVGGGASAWLDIVDAETYAQFEALAEAANLETPAHLLFLGDSLTDQQRDHNYTDMVSFWLNRTHGDVTYRNAGVGGDYITRMWQRLQGEGANRQEMYEGLFEPTPTRVFIWTGHNDSKLKPKPEYQTPDDYPFDPVVPLDEFEETYVNFIEYMRQQAPEAEFTVISASSSVHEITRETVVKRIASAGNGGSYFGKPDALEQFNERMQSVAAATDADYVDVYEPTRTYPDKPSLFTADGVHMTHKGNLLVARLLLEYLGE